MVHSRWSMAESDYGLWTVDHGLTTVNFIFRRIYSNFNPGV